LLVAVVMDVSGPGKLISPPWMILPVIVWPAVVLTSKPVALVVASLRKVPLMVASLLLSTVTSALVEAVIVPAASTVMLPAPWPSPVVVRKGAVVAVETVTGPACAISGAHNAVLAANAAQMDR